MDSLIPNADWLDGRAYGPAKGRALLTVVVPCYDEAEVLPAFHARLEAVMRRLGLRWSVLYVNDGSRDATLDIMHCIQSQCPEASVLNLSRNFGKEAAMTAGLDHADGDAVVVIDADLQDPPEVIPDLVAAWRGGCDVAYAQRRVRDGETWLKRTTARLFYRLMSRVGRVRLPQDTGDFRLMNRRAVDALSRLREHHRFMKGLFAWIGFNQVAVPYDRSPRHAGTTKWNYWKLWNFALEGVTGYTVLPLKLATYVGVLVAAIAGVYGAVIITDALVLGNAVPGYPSLMTVVLLLGGAQLIFLGVLGEYVGRVFNEVKGRPLYFVERFSPARTRLAGHDEARHAARAAHEALTGRGELAVGPQGI